MEEDPKDHDFDQRHDGPTETPAQEERGIKWDQQNGEKKELEQSQSAPEGVLSPSNSAPATGGVKHTDTTWSKPKDSPRRKSTQVGRPSRDFDRRTDGPFGRPSLAMTRRHSSNMTLPTSPTVQSPVTDGAPQLHGDEQPPSDSLQSTDPAFEAEPPPLNYTLWTRKLSIFIFWFLILFDSIAMPIALYFPLWYATDLSHNTVFSIVTAALGGISILEYFLRFWRLWKKGSTCRVIGARRMYLDWFHWNFTAAWLIIMIELIV